MKNRSRNKAAAVPGVCFLLFCVLSGLTGHAAKLRRSQRDPETIPAPTGAIGYRNANKTASDLSGEWRTSCEVKTYRDGKLLASVRESGQSIVIAESDPDGSYFLYKFPVGFGEGLPRLRGVQPNTYVGDDTIRGIKTWVKQLVEMSERGLTIKQTVIDTSSSQVESEISCTGSRSQTAAGVRGSAAAAEVCPLNGAPGDLPGKEVAQRYVSVKPFSDGLSAASLVPPGARTQKWGFIDPTGRVVIPMRYDVVTSFVGGLAAAGRSYGRGRNVKWGIVEKLGPQVTPHLHYDAVKVLGEGFAAVGYSVPGRARLQWNLINRENTMVFHGLDEVGCFVGGRAPASYTIGGVVRRGYLNNVGDFFAEKE